MAQDDDLDTSTSSRLREALEARDVASPRSVMEDNDWSIIDFASPSSESVQRSSLSSLAASLHQPPQQLQPAEQGVEERGPQEDMADQVLRRPLQSSDEEDEEEPPSSASAEPGLETDGETDQVIEALASDVMGAMAAQDVGQVLEATPSLLAAAAAAAAAAVAPPVPDAVDEGSNDALAEVSAAGSVGKDETPPAQAPLTPQRIGASGEAPEGHAWDAVSELRREAARLRCTLDSVVRYICQECANGARGSWSSAAGLCRDATQYVNALYQIVLTELRKGAGKGAAGLRCLAAPLQLLAAPLQQLTAPLQHLAAPLGHLAAPLGLRSRWALGASLTAVAALAALSWHQSHTIRAMQRLADERNKEIAGWALRVLRLQDMLQSSRHMPLLCHTSLPHPLYNNALERLAWM